MVKMVIRKVDKDNVADEHENTVVVEYVDKNSMVIEDMSKNSVVVADVGETVWWSWMWVRQCGGRGHGQVH